MDSLQRLVHRRWTEISQKRASLRLGSELYSTTEDDSQATRTRARTKSGDSSQGNGLARGKSVEVLPILSEPAIANRNGREGKTTKFLQRTSIDFGRFNAVHLAITPKAESTGRIQKVLRASSKAVRQHVIKSTASDGQAARKPPHSSAKHGTEEEEDDQKVTEKNVKTKLSSLLQNVTPDKQRLLNFEEIVN